MRHMCVKVSQEQLEGSHEEASCVLRPAGRDGGHAEGAVCGSQRTEGLLRDTHTKTGSLLNLLVRIVGRIQRSDPEGQLRRGRIWSDVPRRPQATI